MTIKTIYSLIEFISNKLISIEDFSYGTNLEFNESNTKTYPLLYLEFPIMIERPSEREEIFSFSLNLIDKIDEKDPTLSRINIVSKMHQVSLEVESIIKTELKPLNAKFTVVNSITLLDEWADNVSGVQMECRISHNNSVRPCEINTELGSFIDLLNRNSCN